MGRFCVLVPSDELGAVDRRTRLRPLREDAP